MLKGGTPFDFKVMHSFSYKIGTINICNISNQTKIDALLSFIRASELDVIFLQEVQNEHLRLPGFSITFNVDADQRGTAIAVRDQYNVHNVEKSLDNRIISLRIGTVSFINIYAPSGALHRTAREDFFNSSVAHYLHHTTEHVVLGGDFNAVVNAKDATGSSSISPMCKRLMNAAKLVDTWEALHGNDVEFSYIRSNTASRIDRILVVNTMKPQLRAAHFAVTSFSDHKAYVVRMVLPHLGTPCGRGIWRLQAHTLDNSEVIDELSRKWAYWVRARNNYRSWIEWWILYAKPKVISFLKWKSSILHREFRDAIELYRRLLKDAYDKLHGNPSELVAINRIKAQMLQLQRNFSSNLRKNNETYVSGESTTLFHVAQNHWKRSKTSISTLQTEEGNEIRDQIQINGAVRSYFENLYSSGNAVHSTDFMPSRTIPINNHANDNLMRAVTQDEIFAAIRGSNSRKCPGADGLPKEFFLKAWRVICFEFTHVINDALQGKAIKQFFDGILVLVKKKGSDKSVKGYRPISLLNYDYKVLARVLKQRLQLLLPLVLSKHQKCSNGKRSIFEATNRIYDRICQLKHLRKSALLVSFDFDHAFDRVSHSFLSQTMERMNFNPNFVRLLATMWGQSYSKILINGHLTQEFKINRSVRQGDPLSMYLFVLYLQPLLDKISTRLPDAVMNAYADDISMFLDNERSLEEIVSVFNQFGLVSGSVLNKRKTVAIAIGNVNLTAATEWLNIENFVNILGVRYGDNIKQAQKQNWQSILNGLRTQLWLHHPRKLNLCQKVILINTYINSKIWYMASNIPLTKGFATKIKAELGKFIWHGQSLQRIAFANLILPKERGGLNLHCPETKSRALLVNRLINLAPELPFLSSLIENANNRIPTMFNHATLLKSELSLLPDNLLSAPSSREIYRHFLKLKPDPGFVSADQRDWKSVFKNLHSKNLNSAQRSNWYVVMHKKIKHRELLFLRGVVEDPYCEVCPGELDTTIHKLFRCQRVRDIWRFQRRQLMIYGFGLSRLEPEDFVYPTFRNIHKDTKNCIIKSLSIYFSYLIETNENSIELEDFVFYVDNNK